LVLVNNGDGKELLKLRVKEIRLLSTKFGYEDNKNDVLIPHNKISKERIENLSRGTYPTDNSFETIPLKSEFEIKKENQKEILEKMAKELDDLVKTNKKLPARKFYKVPTASIKSVTDQDDYKSEVEIKFVSRKLV
jgi:hypothetical protein